MTASVITANVPSEVADTGKIRLGGTIRLPARMV
jgi:hypothetical protein